MTSVLLTLLFLLLLSILVLCFLVNFVFNERQVYLVKYCTYAGMVILVAALLTPFYIFRPRNAYNIRVAAIVLNPMLSLFGLTYKLENGEILKRPGCYVAVANHQSSLDFIGMMSIWPDYIQYCTILAKKELLWAGPFGPGAWLAGVEFVDRKNRERSTVTMRTLMDKLIAKGLRLWIFPEGTRHMSDTFLPFKLGAFRVAIQAQVPIVPVVFSSYQDVYSADKKNKIFFWRHGCVTIQVLQPISTVGMTLENDLERLTTTTRNQMLEAYRSIHTVSARMERRKIA